ncbi:ABC transporter permease [uncultured Psychroserpens sp.]|uniref:ABC transporter permease n=1 Tax=uncultured Psychroserpens sp. TaxID=255436 RepID=UPI00263752BF|nr:ABC transporter permease [uncultured Psychroserpens sp.]
MFSRDRWNEILEALTSNMFRTILTAFGVFWGIFILIVLLAAGKGLENGVKLDFSGRATNTMNMWAQTISKPYKGLPKGRRFTYKIDDVEAIKDKVPNLKIVSPRNQLGGWGGANNVVRGLKTGAYNVYGDYPEVIQQQPMDITQGRFINYNDINKKRKVAVIGLSVAKELYAKGEEILGSYVKISGVNFSVIGVYKTKQTGGDAEEGQKQIFVPFTAFSQAFNRGDRVGWMMITAEDNVPITDLKEQIFDVVRQRHTIHPDDKRAIGHWDVYEEYSKIEGLFTALRLVAYVVGILVLLSGIIGISNIMLIVVKERTKEIGIRRALGASPWSIRGQILLESIFLTILSGMVGIIFGSLTIYGLNALLDANGPVDMFANPSVDLTVILIALTILIISGLLAGFIPAQNAIRVKPVDALRTE